MEPLLARKITIKKDRTLTSERILKILVDVKEQPVQQQKKENNEYTMEVVIEKNVQILSITKLHRGGMHDLRIRKK